MEYPNNNLYDTALPMMIIEKDKCGREYKWIGSGSEGQVYKYNDQLVFKTFKFFKYPEKLILKFKKIELLAKLHDSAACFPKGFVGYGEKIEGYYYDFVNPHKEFKDFYDYSLFYLKDMRKKLQYIIEADKAIQRFHKMGIILGDIKEDNIMIDADENIKFIDTDNWMYGEYGFDVIPVRADWLSQIYRKEFSRLDNDRFAFAIMTIQLILRLRFLNLWNLNDDFFKNMIHRLNVTNEIKESLRIIFSDANDKPYIGDIIEMIDTEEIISEWDRESLNWRSIRETP